MSPLADPIIELSMVARFILLTIAATLLPSSVTFS
jgi:hypothetical protein